MFQVPQPQIGGKTMPALSAATVAAAQRDAKSAVRDLTIDMRDALQMPVALFDAVRQQWRRKAHDAKPGHYSFDELALEGPLGVVLPYVKFDGVPHLGIAVMSYIERDGDDSTQIGAVEHDCVTEKEHEFLARVWPVEVVTQLRAEKRQRPNDRCACGSGKKFKRCCAMWTK